MATTENINIKLSNSISFKLAVILLLMLLIQIPLSYVSGLIDERNQMQDQAQHDISMRWGQAQHIGAPILNLYSVQKHIQNSRNKELNTNYHEAQSIQSTRFKIDINLDAEKRYLGIYEAAIYRAEINLSGSIASHLINQQKFEDLKLFIPIKYIKGLKKITQITINGKQIDTIPQQKTLNNLNGIEIELDDSFKKEKLSYQIQLTMAGSGQFHVLPLAKETIINLESNWNSPSFTGDSLPNERNITTHGFTASWHLNMPIQSFTKDENNETTALNRFNLVEKIPSVGVNILIPANIYQVNERTVKYSFLIVVLTFSGFFLSELFFKLRLHPFQYLLIGVSLSVFYLLLLSLSEYLTFSLAFLISASSIIVLISSYCSVVLKQRKRGVYTGLLFAILYGFIYILVNTEQTSLLMGAIGIWLILALIMYLTRNIDWYKVNVSRTDNTPNC